MERYPDSRIVISPVVHAPKEWEATLAEPELAVRFNELVAQTQATVSAAEYPWVLDADAVAMRWQHVIDMVGSSARSWGHPLMSNGKGWSDADRVAEVLGPINYRSFDASHTENALILTHSLAVEQQQTDGFAVFLNVYNSSTVDADPKLVAHFTESYDLRDMAEPTETVIGAMTVDDYAHLSPEQRQELYDRLHALTFDDKMYGKGYGFLMPPQKSKYLDESSQLREYAKLIKYGTINEKEIATIRDTRKAEEIAKLRLERSDFGKVPESFNQLSPDIKSCVITMFEYFDAMRQRFELIGIDTYTMGGMEFTLQNITELRGLGILTDQSAYPTPEGWHWSYRLGTDYYECWVARHYPAKEA